MNAPEIGSFAEVSFNDLPIRNTNAKNFFNKSYIQGLTAKNDNAIPFANNISTVPLPASEIPRVMPRGRKELYPNSQIIDSVNGAYGHMKGTQESHFNLRTQQDIKPDMLPPLSIVSAVANPSADRVRIRDGHRYTPGRDYTLNPNPYKSNRTFDRATGAATLEGLSPFESKIGEWGMPTFGDRLNVRPNNPDIMGTHTHSTKVNPQTFFGNPEIPYKTNGFIENKIPHQVRQRPELGGAFGHNPTVTLPSLDIVKGRQQSKANPFEENHRQLFGDRVLNSHLELDPHLSSKERLNVQSHAIPQFVTSTRGLSI
jgi:hypothetical protein